MATFVPTLEARELAGLADDVAELTAPFSRRVERRWHTWTRSRNRVEHVETVPMRYPPLLDTLRAAVHPGGSVRGPERRQIPRSRVLVSEAPHERLSSLERELGGWAERLGLDAAVYESTVRAWLVANVGDVRIYDWQMAHLVHVLDTQKMLLRSLPGQAASIDATVARELVRDVRRWWTWAAVQSGHNAEELRKGRGHG